MVSLSYVQILLPFFQNCHHFLLVFLDFGYFVLFADVVAFHYFAHFAGVQTRTFIFDAFVYFLSESGQSCRVEFHVVFLYVLKCKVILILKGGFLADCLQVG